MNQLIKDTLSKLKINTTGLTSKKDFRSPHSFEVDYLDKNNKHRIQVYIEEEKITNIYVFGEAENVSYTFLSPVDLLHSVNVNTKLTRTVQSMLSFGDLFA